MAVHSAIGARRRGSPPVQQMFKLPAPIKGMDGRVGLAQNNPEYCIYSHNILSGEYGMKVRKGYREHVINLVDVLGTGVKTLIPFDGVQTDGSDSRLFAVTNEGIWDVTVYGAESPIISLAFPDNSPEAGEGIYSHYVDDGGNDFIYFADNLNGLFFYDPTTGIWEAATNISGVDPSKVRFIMIHKQRLWMIEQESTVGWYLPISSHSGQAKPFQFGSQFKHGGKLVGLFNWSVDGGEGVDDYLVAISEAGDILPYRGSDPEATTGDVWSIKGVYFVGAVAGEGNCASESGGDLYILSIYGLTNMSDLLKGVTFNGYRGNSLGSKMSYMLRQDMQRYAQDVGWAVEFMPSEGIMLISVPTDGEGGYRQYAYDLPTDSFGWWRDVPIRCFTAWGKTIYIGTLDNRVLAMDVDVDDVHITPPAEGDNGTAIQWLLLMSYSDLGAPATFKHPVLARPDFLSNDDVSASTKFNFEYSLAADPVDYSIANNEATVWDAGIWDVDPWANSDPIPLSSTRGGFGYGRSVALAMKGAAKSRTWLISVDIAWVPAGVL